MSVFLSFCNGIQMMLFSIVDVEVEYCLLIKHIRTA